MNAVIKRTSFAPGNYVNAEAFSNTARVFDSFIATSRLIHKVKTGLNKIEAVLITAVDRPASKTKAKSHPPRELFLSIPADFAVGVHLLKSRDDVSFSLRNADGTVCEGVAGSIELEPATGNNVKGKFSVNVEDSDGSTFLIKGKFQVLKA